MLMRIERNNVLVMLLLVVRCSLFVVRCLLFVVCCSLFVVCCLLFVVRCLLFVVVVCLLFVVVVTEQNRREQIREEKRGGQSSNSTGRCGTWFIVAVVNLQVERVFTRPIGMGAPSSVCISLVIIVKLDKFAAHLGARHFLTL